MKNILITLFILFPFLASAQITQQATSGIPSQQLSGIGNPSASYTCNAAISGVSFIQTDAMNGRLWLCDPAILTWVHLYSPVVGVATTATVAGGTNLLGGSCTTPITVNITGAVVGTNTATASPIYATAPTGNQGLFNLTAWVSAANTVTVQGCAVGLLTSYPAFQAKVLLY